jgi:hypothetical protein
MKCSTAWTTTVFPPACRISQSDQRPGHLYPQLLRNFPARGRLIVLTGLDQP